MDPVLASLLRDMGFTVWVPRRDASALPVAEAEPAAAASLALSVPPLERASPAVEPASQTPAERPDWDALESAVAGCTRCALAAGRTRTVFGVGARDARWMIVGEAPGAEEDKRGEPFVGRAGKLLDAMLAALGLARGEVFITNIVKCRPPGNRDPQPQEAATCRPYLAAQIDWVKPALILALGRVAAQNLLGVETPVGRLRGRVHQGPNDRPLVVTYHPAYLLRTPSAKQKVWEDLKLALATASPRAA